MAERDPEFVQDVLKILYQALTDRAALAAALGQAPMPPVAPAPAPAAQNPSAWTAGTEIIIRVGPSAAQTVFSSAAPDAYTLAAAACCPDTQPPGRMATDATLTMAASSCCPDTQPLSFAEPIEGLIAAIGESYPLSRDEVVNEALRRLLAAEIQKFAAERGVSAQLNHRPAPPEPPSEPQDE